jgi:MFS family permease
MVSRSQFTAANALLQSTTSLGILLGPTLSGLGIAVSSSKEVLCMNAVTYLASAACLLPIRLADATTSRPAKRPIESFIRDLTEGFRYVRTQRTILLLTLLASLYTFATGAFTTLFPVFGRKMLDLGPVEVGYLWSWLGIGLFLMSIGLVWLTEWEFSKRVQAISVSSAVGGAALCGLTWAHDMLIATLLVGVIGMGIGTLTPIAWGILQETSPAEMVGRVMAIYTAIVTATSMAGMTFFGWVTETFHERIGILGIALVLFLMAVVAAWFSRRIRTGDGVPPGHAPA